MDAKEKSRPLTTGSSWLFFAELHTRLQSVSRKPCRLQQPTGHLNRPYPATYPLLSPPPIAQWESEIGGRYWYNVGRTEKNLFGFPGGPPIFLSGSPTQICRHIPVKLLVDSNTCPVSSSRDLAGAAPSPVETSKTRFPRNSGGYSSTNSEQRDGRLAYATVDLGWTWRSEGIKLGFLGATFITSNA